METALQNSPSTECGGVLNVLKFTVDGLGKIRQTDSSSDKSNKFRRAKYYLRHLMLRDNVSTAKTNKGISEQQFVAWCIGKIELAEGGDLEGIYRKSGSCAAINRLQAFFDVGEIPSEDVRSDARCVADLLKRHFRSMPEPLLPKKRHRQLISCLGDDNASHQVQHLKRVIDTLPDANRHLCATLFTHLGQLLEREPATKMTAQSLAKVWAPNIFGLTTMTAGVTETIDKQIAVTELLIVHHASFFPNHHHHHQQQQNKPTSSSANSSNDDISSIDNDDNNNKQRKIGENS